MEWILFVQRTRTWTVSFYFSPERNSSHSCGWVIVCLSCEYFTRNKKGKFVFFLLLLNACWKTFPSKKRACFFTLYLWCMCGWLVGSFFECDMAIRTGRKWENSTFLASQNRVFLISLLFSPLTHVHFTETLEADNLIRRFKWKTNESAVTTTTQPQESRMEIFSVKKFASVRSS